MPENEPTVFVVDDDKAVCESLQWLLESAGLRACTFDSAAAFLAAWRPDQPGCLVLDVRMRGMSGLDLQRELSARGATLPILMITGHGDVPMAVRAVKNGALEFLEKPVDDQVLLQQIRRALAIDGQRRAEREAQRETIRRLRTLTRREREVLLGVVAGAANKQIAVQLGIAAKTVEAHRKHVMEKMDVRNTADLVRRVMSVEGAPGNPL